MGEAGGGGSSGGGGGDAASRIGPDEKTDLAFKAFDKNQDGYITKNEMLKTSKNLTKRQVQCLNFLMLCVVVAWQIARQSPQASKTPNLDFSCD